MSVGQSLFALFGGFWWRWWGFMLADSLVDIVVVG